MKTTFPYGIGRLSGALSVSLLLLLGAGCPSPNIVLEGPFTRSLKSFVRMDPRILTLDPALKEGPSERGEWIQAYAREYRKDLLYRLHRKKFLDAPDGPMLIVEGRLLKYEWTETQGTSERPSSAEGTLEVAFTFKDETGARIGAGTITAAGHASGPRGAMESAEKQVVYSLYKFLRKAIGRPESGPAETEPEAPRLESTSNERLLVPEGS